MECKSANALLMKYMDKALTKNEAMKLNRHLDSCASCKSDFEIYDDMLTSFSDITLFEAPPNFELQVEEKLKNVNIYNKNLAASTEAMICALLGTASVIIAAVIMLISNRDTILNYMSETPALAGLSNFLKPLTSMMESYFANVAASVGSFNSTLVSFAGNFRYAFLAAAVLLFAAQFVISRRAAKNKSE